MDPVQIYFGVFAIIYVISALVVNWKLDVSDYVDTNKMSLVGQEALLVLAAVNPLNFMFALATVFILALDFDYK